MVLPGKKKHTPRPETGSCSQHQQAAQSYHRPKPEWPGCLDTLDRIRQLVLTAWFVGTPKAFARFFKQGPSVVVTIRVKMSG